MERIGNSDTYFGRHVFSEEPTFSETIEQNTHDLDHPLTDLITARAQQFTVAGGTSITLKKLRRSFMS